jgi:hypothetical protein
MADTYTAAPTRVGMVGVKDKLALISAMSDKYAHNRDFAERVLHVVRNSGNGADGQVKAWESFVEGLPYRREQGEVLRNPVATAFGSHNGKAGSGAVGGDCDDLVIATLAGLRSLGLEAVPQIIARENGDGFHIRVLVAMPPINPTHWRVIDPVWRSERQWAMVGKPKPVTGPRHLVIPNVSAEDWKASQRKAGPHWLLQLAVAILAFKTVDALLARPK